MSDVPPTSGDRGRPWNEGRSEPTPRDPATASRRPLSSRADATDPGRSSAATRGSSGADAPDGSVTGRRRLGSSSSASAASTATAGSAGAGGGSKGRSGFKHAAPTSKKRVATRVVVGIVAVIALIAAGVVGYGWYRYNQINRDDLALASSSDGVQNILIVGSDSRAAVDRTDADASAFLNAKGADQGGQRSDTIMVARVDSKNKTIDLVSFPRDLWVPIAPSGSEERINTAFAMGKDSADGAQRLIDTIKADFGIDINHYVEINFKSFKGITEAVGGVPLYFSMGVRDRNSGFYQYDKGCHTLVGDQAIAYARSRHLEYWDEKNRKWIEDPSGDLGRISRQTLFMRTLLDRAQKKFGSMDVGAINGIISSTADNLALDKGFGIGEMVSLGKSFKGFTGDQIQTHALPVYLDMTSGGASILRLDTAAAEDILNIFRGLPAGTVLPTSVKVSVANASGVKGQSKTIADRLDALGYTTTAAGDLAKTQATTVVKYMPGFEAQADLVARQLAGGATTQSDKSLTAKDPVQLILGTTFTSVLDVATPATTTTTIEGAATTTTGPMTTVKSGEVIDFVGILAGKAPAGTVCD